LISKELRRFTTKVIQSGVITRWNTYLQTCRDVYNTADALARYAREVDQSEAFQRAWLWLQSSNGFKLIGTLVMFLEPIMALCISLVLEC
jgi:hypothetical protein